MIDTRVASRYAKSLLELAIEKDIVDKVHQDMVSFSALCKSNREFVLMLKNPIISHDKKKKILYSIFEGKVDSSTLAIFDVITRKNRENYLPAIAEEFDHQYKAYRGISEAVITTPFPLTDPLRKRFEQMVLEKTGKKEVALEEKVDESLIGGYILKISDQQIDDSIKSKLIALAYEFGDDSYVKTF